MELLHSGAAEGIADLFDYTEGVVGVGALAVGTQVVGQGLRAGGRNPEVIETGVKLVNVAATRVPHAIFLAMGIEGGLALGSAADATRAAAHGSCQW